MSKSSPRFLLVLLAAALGACDRQPVEVVSPELAGAFTGILTAAQPQGAVLAQIRAGTARYHRVEAAEADGYQPLPFGCVAGEGIRYVRFDLYFDGVVDPTGPEQLLYEPLPNGRLRLAGVQFLVPQRPGLDAALPLPYLGEQPFMDRRSPPFGAPFPNYALFAWVWTHNPNGMYTQHNPEVTC